MSKVMVSVREREGHGELAKRERESEGHNAWNEKAIAIVAAVYEKNRYLYFLKIK